MEDATVGKGREELARARQDRTAAWNRVQSALEAFELASRAEVRAELALEAAEKAASRPARAPRPEPPAGRPVGGWVGLQRLPEPPVDARVRPPWE